MSAGRSVRAGRLRYRVTVQRLQPNSPQRHPSGAPDKTWVDFLTLWADVRPLQGRMLYAAQQISDKVTTEIDVRYSSASAQITAAMRVKHGSVVYEIESVPPVRPANGAKLVLSCATGVTQG